MFVPGFISHLGKLLNVLRIPMSEVTDEMVEKHVHSLSKLTVLDISYCLNISSKGIELLGRHCKSIVQLRRNMPPPAIEMAQNNGVVAMVDELEAMAIASSMPCLEHLELAFGKFSDRGLEAILGKCRALTVLDIRGCWNVRLEDDLEIRCEFIKSFRDPWEDDYEINPATPIDEGEAPPPPVPAIAVAEEDDDDWDWDDDDDNVGDDDVVGAPADVVNVSDDDDDNGAVDAPVDVVSVSDDDDDDAGGQMEMVEISDDD